ncbi:hypothetical protein C2857_002531 [Epichloe festucae Fl1]|uniref:Uncharacterized protein n=1 Tax=Epichloe festucae (strain Fl1) TaxID=877507 RepID=A0A7U3Q1D1_EPIFF|nr:hypothetical protein C2857_002531 [Epichloe festucae Fl1]
MRAYAVLSWAVNAAAAANIVATLASSLEPPLGQPTADAVPGPAPYGQAQSPTANISLVLVRPAPASSTEAMAAATQDTFPSTPGHNHGTSETGSEDGRIDPGALVGVGTSAALAGGVMLSALVFLSVRWRRRKKSSGDEENPSTRRWLRISDLEKPRPLLQTHAPGPDFATTVRDSFSTAGTGTEGGERTSSAAASASNKEDLMADPATRGHWRPMRPSSSLCRAPRRSRATPPGFVTGGIGVAMSSRQMVERGDSMSMGVVARPGAAWCAQSWYHEPWSPALPPSLAPSSDRSSYGEFG